MATVSALVMFGLGLLFGCVGVTNLAGNSTGLGVVGIVIGLLMIARSNTLWRQRQENRQHKELLDAMRKQQ